ncbi:nuclear RNA export factor 1-like isoform X2 [Gordionus sp. m RMFG-2023]|uniref:nuclear RNA export factor 1-like isoform X2 n=1 Tax=Gordionus sp. m RMFG-2023 TaxID=3053472 RepID=UPI0031FBC06F
MPKHNWRQTYKPPPLRKLMNFDNEGDIPMNDMRLQIRTNAYNSREVLLGRNKQNPSTNFKKYSNKSKTVNQNNDSNWYKMIVPYGNKMGKEYLVNIFQQHISQSLNPVNACIQGNAFVFWTNNIETYKQLINISLKLKSPDGFKIKILGVKDRAPNPPELDANYAEKLRNVMSIRYNIDLKMLNLSNFANDSNLKSQSIYLPLFRPNVLKAVINIIQKHVPDVEFIDLSSNKISYLYHLIPLSSAIKNIYHLSLANNQIKSESELIKIRQFPLRKLTLSGNPLVKYYADTDAYISAIRKIFPELEILDEMELPKIIKFDLENSLTLPFIRPSYYVNDEIKTLIQRFLHQYFTLYDSKNRIELCHAYDENAYFSLSSGGTSASFLNKKHSDIKTYLVGSRNLERIKDKDRRRKYMHQGCDKIASFLNLLPDTIHDYPSFVVDVVLYTNTLLVFSLTGFFKDSAKREFETGLIRYFSRTFYTIPFGQGIKIINDMLYIMPPAQDMIKKIISISLLTILTSCLETTFKFHRLISITQIGLIRQF